jgi:diacylglycerol kinase
MDKVFISLRNAFFGLKYCFCTQRNMVIHALVGILVIAAALLLRVTLTGILFLLTAVFSVLVAEAFNTAIEKTIDLYTSERKKLARIAKDVAAGAVLLTSLFAVVVGILILGLPLWQFLSSL